MSKIKSEILDMPFYAPMADGPVAIAHQTNTPPQIEFARKIMTDYGLPPYVEVDVVTNHDGTPMVFHGANWPRDKIKRGLHTPSGLGARRMSDDDLRQYNSDHPDQRISTLEEILGDFPDVRFVLHLKNNQPLELADVLKKTNSYKNVLAGAAGNDALQDLRDVLQWQNKEIPMLMSALACCAIATYRGRMINPESPKSNLRVAKDYWAKQGYATSWNAISPISREKWLTSNQIEALHEHFGIPIIATKMNLHATAPKAITPEYVDRQLNKGLDGFIEDDVAVIAAAAAKKRRSR
jgi:hypothetical protein